MKVQAINEITTVSPEKHWSTGEILELPDEVAQQLLVNNPNFKKIREAQVPVRRVRKPVFLKKHKK